MFYDVSPLRFLLRPAVAGLSQTRWRALRVRLRERTSAVRDEGSANDTQDLGSQIVLSPDLFRPTDRAFAGSVSPSCSRPISSPRSL
jgi:hypothetical protein